MMIPSPTPRRPRAESVVPMINVVFLLLIFFLMTAQLAPPDPLEITPPRAASETEPAAQVTLSLGQGGELRFGDLSGDSALDAVADQASEATIQLRADGNVDAAIVAQTLTRLTERGLKQVELVVTP